jgi:UDP-N-acetylmuramoyl-tripeptide--D-alanyl-D-alanine ligase
MENNDKELIHVVLSKNIKATVGNLNNHIGVPLTLQQKLKSIVEMGANQK